HNASCNTRPFARRAFSCNWFGFTTNIRNRDCWRSHRKFGNEHLPVTHLLCVVGTTNRPPPAIRGSQECLRINIADAKTRRLWNSSWKVADHCDTHFAYPKFASLKRRLALRTILRQPPRSNQRSDHLIAQGVGATKKMPEMLRELEDQLDTEEAAELETLVP